MLEWFSSSPLMLPYCVDSKISLDLIMLPPVTLVVPFPRRFDSGARCYTHI